MENWYQLELFTSHLPLEEETTDVINNMIDDVTIHNGSENWEIIFEIFGASERLKNLEVLSNFRIVFHIVSFQWYFRVLNTKRGSKEQDWEFFLKTNKRKGLIKQGGEKFL